ncbi:MAG: ATPase, T2SS/T4P/T4SS family [Verrucomicrobiota bacterium]|nr:ATPase, T2SS/T4P/T4SS family [Verrucomicrobiota bacterium]
MALGKITDILVKRGLIDPAALAAAEHEAFSQGIRIEKHLLEKNLVSASDMTLTLAEYLGIVPIALSHFAPPAHLLDSVSREMLIRRRVIPIAKMGNTLTVALADPFDLIARDELHVMTGLEITPLVAAEKEITETFERAFPDQMEGMNMEEILKEADSDQEITHQKVRDEEDESIEAIIERSGGSTVVRIVSMVLVEALRQSASDIHLEPQEKTLRLRYRIDGALMEVPGPPKSLQGAVVSRMKLMSNMDIAEHRVPQDGRIKLRALGKEVDLRVNMLPTIFGEKTVMRILDRAALFPSLSALGLDEAAYVAMRRAISEPNGILLVTGPTGSGKTTTLYSCLMELNQPDVNIVTCEDPVEYQLPGVNQVQINSFIGLTFAAALRSVLRQSPDIILVGEIRDNETADIAIKAALTGHLVLSTLHTNDAPSAITRMVDMGVEPSLLSSALILAQAQRLLRKLCPSCKKPAKELQTKLLRGYNISPELFDGVTTYEAGSCMKCRNSGYKGRMAIMEALPVDRELRADILNGLSSKDLAAHAKKKGMLSLKEIGLNKVRDGITSLDAALSITGGGE